MCLICQWWLSSSSPWWEIQKHGAVPIVFTDSGTGSINLTQEALHASSSPTQTFTLHAYIRTRAAIKRLCVTTLQVNTHPPDTQANIYCFCSCMQMTEIQLEFRLCFDSDLSGLLCLSVNFIFVLMWPAAFTVSHDSSQCESKEWAIPYHTTPKKYFISFWQWWHIKPVMALII